MFESFVASTKEIIEKYLQVSFENVAFSFDHGFSFRFCRNLAFEVCSNFLLNLDLELCFEIHKQRRNKLLRSLARVFVRSLS